MNTSLLTSSSPSSTSGGSFNVGSRSSGRRNNIRRAASRSHKYKDYVCEDDVDNDTDEDHIQDYIEASNSARIQNIASSSSKKGAKQNTIKNVDAARPKVQANGVVEPFPVKLHNMLSGTEDDGLQHIVSWQPHGRCFIVHSPAKFVTDVMPTYFKQSKFPSFQRQLNLYGFKRITKGLDKNGYYHPKFLRGQPDLSMQMIRMKINGKGKRRPTRPEDEPDFYSMPPLEEDIVDDEDTETTTSIEDIVEPIKSSQDMPITSYKGGKKLSSLSHEPITLSSLASKMRPSRTTGSRGKSLINLPTRGSTADTNANIQNSHSNRIVTPPITPQSSELNLTDALDCALLIGVQTSLPADAMSTTVRDFTQQLQPLPHAMPTRPMPIPTKPTFPHSSVDHFAAGDRINQEDETAAAEAVSAWSSLPPSPCKARDVSTYSTTSAASANTKSSYGDDVLFFEGLPFHYLE